MSPNYKVPELEGALLDAAVAKAEGLEPMPQNGGWFVKDRIPALPGEWIDLSYDCPKWSTAWHHAGPIIERERIIFWPAERAGEWRALHPDGEGLGGFYSPGRIDVTEHDGMPGPTALVAAMRAFVASKFGEEVELP